MLNSERNLYIASPYGFAESTREFYYGNIVHPLRRAGFNILDPWQLTDQLEINKVLTMPLGDDKIKALKKMNLMIAENNVHALNRAHGVVGILDGVDVDSGVAAEIGIGYQRGLPILGYRNDFRVTGENEGCVVNLQVEGLITMSGGRIVREIKELVPMAVRLFKLS